MTPETPLFLWLGLNPFSFLFFFLYILRQGLTTQLTPKLREILLPLTSEYLCSYYKCPLLHPVFNFLW